MNPPDITQLKPGQTVTVEQAIDQSGYDGGHHTGHFIAGTLMIAFAIVVVYFLFRKEKPNAK